MRVPTGYHHIALCHPSPHTPDESWPFPKTWHNIRASHLWGTNRTLIHTPLILSDEIELTTVQRWPLEPPQLVTFDMDSTLIEQEVIDEVARATGCHEEVAKITEQAMQGKIDFKASLRARVACLQGLNVNALNSVLDNIQLSPGVQQLVRVLKQCGVKTAIISGGFEFVAKPLAQALQMDAVICHRFEVAAGKLTGKVEGDIVDAEGKARALRQLAHQWQIPLARTMAIGDGANDLAIMQTAAMGIAWRAKPIVAAQADLAIHQLDLDAVCWLYETWAESWLKHRQPN